MSTDWDSLPLTNDYWRNTDEELFGHHGSDGDDDVSMQNVSDQLAPPPSTSGVSRLPTDDQDIEFVPAKGKGKGKQKAVVGAHDEDVAPSYVFGPKGISSKAKGKQKAVSKSPSHTTAISPNILAEHALSQYTCPICFCPPTNATMTLCGHVACGSCLFTAVKTAMRRENMMGAASREDGGPRCVVQSITLCRNQSAFIDVPSVVHLS